MSHIPDLTPIQARHDAATGGTWYVNRGSYGDPDFVLAESHGHTHDIGSLDFGMGDQANANRDFVLHAHTDMATLLAYADNLRTRFTELEQRLAAEERAHASTVTERDRASEYADRLADRLAPSHVIGEHTIGNCPWQNALDYDGPAIS